MCAQIERHSERERFEGKDSVAVGKGKEDVKQKESSLFVSRRRRRRKNDSARGKEAETRERSIIHLLRYIH